MPAASTEIFIDCLDAPDAARLALTDDGIARAAMLAKARGLGTGQRLRYA